ncbi:bacterial low temperature requirement A protein-domain-containing protein [Gamsiella multidivaricata]|uniref:bacterial low temperature requirement A protein-domain-containing protein n=1 Tax=Gamsiella multidivaricata TaxID=101098 RepID=UPI00222025F4|nr:bacterial low temperature requirement A protein-domain-containing protein [Gamsiella multidivaricata]KAI7830617.1 bacterial low temperature requirement A protein-domain-containing protein [Gamsiella multidivaricata]
MADNVIELGGLSNVSLDPENPYSRKSNHDIESTQSPQLSKTTLTPNARSRSTLYRVPFSQSPYSSTGLWISTPVQHRRSIISEAEDQSRLTSPTGSSQMTFVNCFQHPTSDQPIAAAKEELFLHITPLPHESPADALTRHHNLSPRDIHAIAQNLMLDQKERESLPKRCCPVDLQHHIQTELMRRVHLGINIGIPQYHVSHHRSFHLSDSPFVFEIRDSKPCHPKDGEEKGPGGPGKYAFKKPVADLSEQLGSVGEKKSATWMELFFDLTFVANITIFTHEHPIIDSTTLLRYCGWFTILWWMWLSQTMFDVRFSTDDLLNRIWKLIQLFALAGFAGNGDHFASTNSNGFALSYAVMKLVLVGQYFIVWMHAPDARSRRPILLYMSTNFISFVMWWVSAFLIEMLSDQARYAIWFSAIGIEVLANVALANNATVTFVRSHLPERLGLFTLIILGESVMGLFIITDKLVDAPERLGWDNLTLLIFSITLVKCQWFLYFDDYHERGPVRSSIHSTLWTYLHFMLNLSQLLLGVGCLDLIRVYQFTKNPTQSIKNIGQSHEAAGNGGASMLSSALSKRSITSLGDHDMVLIYVKKYYLIVAASVFFWNAAIKCVTSRPGDKYDRAIYVSRFFMSFVVLCLLLVEHHRLSAFSLLGLEVGFCLLQVGHDLLVLYYAARKEYDSQYGPTK